ncbi:MAG: AAA family ATPase [Candidatus Omnitrophica bacterium]|nr:AAA family ATPase [Candidatus Omnitrophota bacterium]
MYENFYGFKEKPFNVTADPTFFYLSRRHKEAFSHLVYGIQDRKGILEITGEIGTGKTTLCRALLNHLDRSTKTAFILNPYLSQVQLLQAIMADLGLNLKSRTKLALINALNDFLLREANCGNNVVILIDEAQNLSSKQLEQIRLLSNLETEKLKLLQIVLVGQPELCDKLKQPSLRQLNQRIAVRYHILPLERDELEEYIKHRLHIARAKSKIEFSQDALSEIFSYSGGTPRLINILCDRALLAGFVLETNTISRDLIKKCIEELG